MDRRLRMTVCGLALAGMSLWFVPASAQEETPAARLPAAAGIPCPDGTWAWPHLDAETLLQDPRLASGWRRESLGIRMRAGRRVRVVVLVRADERDAELEDWLDPETGLLVGGRRGPELESARDDAEAACGDDR